MAQLRQAEAAAAALAGLSCCWQDFYGSCYEANNLCHQLQLRACTTAHLGGAVLDTHAVVCRALHAVKPEARQEQAHLQRDEERSM